jgi:uncharacterized protein with HEPN domain
MSDLLYLEHILERIERIEEAAEKGRGAFNESHVIQDAVIRNFEVIGEAVKQISDERKDAYPGVPWRRIAGFRDILIHQYMGVDLDEVWNVIDKDLPPLKSTVQTMLSELDDSSSSQ